MTFDDWLETMRNDLKAPFGVTYELFAREAWNAATITEREACAKVCEDVFAHLGRYDGGAADLCGDQIRGRGVGNDTA